MIITEQIANGEGMLIEISIRKLQLFELLFWNLRKYPESSSAVEAGFTLLELETFYLPTDCVSFKYI